MRNADRSRTKWDIQEKSPDGVCACHSNAAVQLQLPAKIMTLLLY